MIKPCITFRTLKYGNYGLFLDMGNAGFIPSTVVLKARLLEGDIIATQSDPYKVQCIAART